VQQVRLRIVLRAPKDDVAQTLESLGLMMIGLAKNGAGSWDIAMKVDIG